MNDYNFPIDKKPSDVNVDLLGETEVKKNKPCFKTRRFLYVVIAILLILVIIFFALFLRLALKPTLPEICEDESCISASTGMAESLILILTLDFKRRLFCFFYHNFSI